MAPPLSDRLMLKKAWLYLRRAVTVYLDAKTEDINHNSIISELYTRTELSGSYLGSIVLANQIALMGLLVNSVAVVIGAMLISPLMGPIFSLALAFTMGDLRLARLTVRNIGVSILLVIIVATFTTLISPLQQPTQEILSRVRPNIYDLLIAAFAGTAGALALCTRKNYLFTTTGVAVATAVIPPLSVVGYGIGTWQLSYAMGGFLLFFTNLVAIVISSSAVFYTLRFRGAMVEEAAYPLRKRFQILGCILAIVSIPLVYTLVVDIRKVKLSGRIERSLKSHLNLEDHARLTGFSIDRNGGKIKVRASVNTVEFIGSETEKVIQKALADDAGQLVTLDLEQVIVKSGNVNPRIPAPLPLPAVKVPPPPPENLVTLHDKVMKRVSEGCKELQPFLGHSPVRDCSVSFSASRTPITVKVTVGRDYPFTAQEQRWLQVALARNLNEDLAVEVRTEPLLPSITFDKDNQPDEASRKSLAVLRQPGTVGKELKFVIEIPRGNQVAEKKVRALRGYLIKELSIPASRIATARNSGRQIFVRVLAK